MSFMMIASALRILSAVCSVISGVHAVPCHSPGDGQRCYSLCVSATKSILGHLINAAASVELAITALGM